MSLIRWGELDSSVYVIGEPDDGAWLCVACGISEKPARFKSDDVLLSHLAEHQSRGDTIPLAEIKARMHKDV